MTRLYRLVTTLLTLAILVTACGGQPAAEDGATPPKETTRAEDSAVGEATTEGEVAETEVATGSAEADIDDTCEAGQRLFDHEMLATDPVCIPEDPQRIVIAWPLGMTSLLRADVPLVGASSLSAT